MSGLLTWAIVFLPLAGSLINAIWGRRLGRPLAGIVACAALGASFLLSLRLLFLDTTDVVWGPWIRSGSFEISFHLHIDHLSAVMASAVSGVGTLIHVYSLGYMAEDARFSRYFSCLNLFAGSMLLLVLAGELVLLYVGWEGVGLCSYLLIGHWFERREASAAAVKAMLINRVGDASMLLGILLLWARFCPPFAHTTNISVLMHAVGTMQHADTLTLVVCLLLFVGATAKSAQLPALWVWLPDAMEGPTPVSALIHAATMVTAGVYLVARLHPLFAAAPAASAVVAIVGVATALFAATVAAIHSDIKKVLAYSTISQLGYMFLACGVGAYSAAIFHLVTHAFFKALLFLGAGSVMHALGDEKDMNRMGGLASRMPLTYLSFLAGSLSLAALPIWSGFFSKEAILSSAFAAQPWLWVVALLTAAVTAYYAFRQVWMVFLGQPRDAVLQAEALGHDPGHHLLGDPPSVMTWPVAILAVGATIAGFIGLPAWSHVPNLFEAYVEGALGKAPETSAALGMVLGLVAIAASLIGLWIARRSFMEHPSGAREWQRTQPGLARWITHRYYIEEALTAVFIRGGERFAALLAGPIDQGGIDRVAEGTGRAMDRLGRRSVRAQTGRIPDYLFIFAVGALAAFIAVAWRAWR